MTREELAAALRKADAAGNADDARRLASAIRQMDAGAVSASSVALPKPAPMSQPDATPWGDGQAFDDLYARKPKTDDPLLSPLRPNARTLTSGQPTRMKPPPAPRGPVMSPSQRMATQPARDADVARRTEQANRWKNDSPFGTPVDEMGVPIAVTDAQRDGGMYGVRDDVGKGIVASPIHAERALVGAAEATLNTPGDLARSLAVPFAMGFDPTMQGIIAGAEFGVGADTLPERFAAGAKAGGYMDMQQKLDAAPRFDFSAAKAPVPKELESVSGALAEGLAQFLISRKLVGKVAPGGGLAANMGKDAAAVFVGMDGSTGRMADVIDANAIPQGPLRDYFNFLKTQPDDSPALGRFKNFLEDLTVSGPMIVPQTVIAPAARVVGNAINPTMTPTNAGGVTARAGLTRPQITPVAPAAAATQPQQPVAPTATQTAQQAPTQPQTATAPPVPPIPPTAPAVTAGAAQPVPARSRAEQRADDIFMKKMEADGVTVEDIRKVQARLARRGDSGVYETSGEIAAMTDNSSGANLRGLQMAGGAAPGPLQEALVGLVNQNTDKLSSRLSRGATRATGQKADNAVATLDELENRLRTEAAPAYDTAYATAVDPQVFANEIVPVLNTPSGQKALQSARNNLASVAADLQARAARGASERAMMEAQRAQAAVKSIDDYMADPVRGTAIPTTMALDYTKRAFDDVIADAGFGSDTARIVGATKRNFADSVSQATGGNYGTALGVFEDVKRLEDAFEVGTEALNKKTWQLERDIAKGRSGSPWTAGEVEALAMGVARNIEDLIEANNQSALTKLLKDKALKNVATALGSQKAADMFEETIRRLGANREWGRRVAGGSDTAMRQAAIRDAGMEGEDAITRVLDRVETSGNQFSLPGLVNDVAVKPIARTAKDIYQRLRYPGVYDEEVNRALIPLIGKPMTEANLNEVIRRVEARMAEKGLIPPAPPAAVAAPPPAPRRRPRGPGGNPPGTTSSASAPITGMVAGGIGGAMVPADDENEQLMNALFGAAGGAAAGSVAARLSKGGKPKPPPASAQSAGVKPPPVKNGLGSRDLPMDEASRMSRAREMGFDVDTPLYHGTDKSFDEFSANPRNRNDTGHYGKGTYFSTQPGEANYFAEWSPGADAPSPTARVIKAYAKGKLFDVTDGGDVTQIVPDFLESVKGLKGIPKQIEELSRLWDDAVAKVNVEKIRVQMDPYSRRMNHSIPDELIDADGVATVWTDADSAAAIYYPSKKDAVSDLAYRQLSRDGVRFPMTVAAAIQRNIGADEFSKLLKQNGYDGVRAGDEVVIFDPKNIRSADAKFDPAESGSSKLLAGMSGNSRGIADNLKQDAGIAALGSVGGSFANQDDPQAGALGGMGLALAGKYGGRAVNAVRGAGRVKPPPVRGAAQGKFRGPDQQTFGGVNAKTADKVALARAQNMEAEGAGRDAIWDETGWFKGVDGKWRFEIDDSGAKLTGVKKGPLGEVMKHPELYKAYPDLAGAQTVVGGKGGAYIPPAKYNDEMIQASANDTRSIVLHEAGGHGVQEREGFARGAGGETFTQQKDAELARDAMSWRKEIAAKRKQMPNADWIAVENAVVQDYQKMGAMEWLPSRQARDLARDKISNPDEQLQELINVYQLDKYVSTSSPMTMYRRTAGEVDARNIQTRDAMRLRGEKPGRPWETQDVPDDQQIVRFGSGKAESRPTPPKGQKAPPKGPGTVSRMVAGGAVGGLGGSLGGDANAQEDLTAEMAKAEGQISTVQQEIAALKKAKADFDKMTDVKEKQRFLNRAGDYTGAIDGDIKGLTTAGIQAWDARNAKALEKAEKELAASRATLDDLRKQDAYRQMQKEQNPFFDAVRELGPSGAAVLGGVAATVLRMRGVGKSAKAVKQIENDINDLLTNGPVKKLIAKGGAANQPRNRAVNMNQFYRRGGAPDNKLPFNYGPQGWKANPKAAKPGSLYKPETTTKMDGVGSQFIRPTDIKIIGAGLLDSALVTPFVSEAEEELKKAKQDVENGNESIEALRRVEKAKTDLAMYQAIQRLGWGIAGAGALGMAYRYKLPRPDIRGAEDEVTAIADYLKSKAPPRAPRTPRALPPPATPQPPPVAGPPAQLLLPAPPPLKKPKPKPKPKPKKP